MRSVATRIVDIIRDNFPNGIRDDFIDTNKVLKMFSTSCVEEGNLSRDSIVKIIRVNGLENGGRFYFITRDDTRKILRFVKNKFNRLSFLSVRTAR